MLAPPCPSVTIVLPHRESFDPASAGAVAMVVQRLAAGQSRYPTLVVGPRHRGAGFPGIAFRPVRIAQWLPLTATQKYAVSLAGVFAGLPPGLIEVHNKPDVALLLARLFPQRPVSLFLHNDPREMRGARSPAARERLLRRLARIVTVSAYVRRCLLEGVALPTRPPVVLHNALDPALMPASLPTAERDKVILFAGRVVPQKGPDLFVAACAKALPLLPGWRAEIIGADGFSAAKENSAFIQGLRPAAEAAGVVLHGYRTHTEVLQAMARAAIVVVPSRWEEPFGLTALEAMACGAPLVSAIGGGLAEVVGDACIRIDPNDTDAVARALVGLAGDPAKRTALSAAGLGRARSQFSTSDAIAALDALRDQATGLTVRRVE